MQTLRNATFFARLVLAWFALSLGVAMASPIVKPQAVELICSGGVAKLVSQGDDSTPAGPHTLDCPLCAATGGPPVPAPDGGPAVQPLARVLQSIPAARIAALTAAPPPARGPPALATF